MTYPLGPYLALSRWLADHPAQLLEAPEGTGVLDLRPWQKGQTPAPDPAIADAATAFDAVLYAATLTAASHPDERTTNDR